MDSVALKEQVQHGEYLGRVQPLCSEENESLREASAVDTGLGASCVFEVCVTVSPNLVKEKH